jgi:hypothetical protein
MKANQIQYDYSNSIITVSKKSFGKETKKIAVELLNSGESKTLREKRGQKLLDSLCNDFNIPCLVFSVVDKCQNHTTINGKLRSKTLGFYTTLGTITIFNLTAKQKKIVAIKTFFDTLLHEFIHHYDLSILKIPSIHSAGFYKRISDLKEKLLKGVTI